VTADGAWIDFGAEIGGADLDVTVFYDRSAGAVTGSWCDAAPCDRSLGTALSQQGGYRSFAWAGAGFGTRVITNPLDPGGGESSNRGTYLRFEGEAFERLPGGGGNFRPSGAFADADRGWLGGPVEIAGETAPARLVSWPVSVRAPLTDVTSAPGGPPGSLGLAVLAVGADGGVLRYAPGHNPNGAQDDIAGVCNAAGNVLGLMPHPEHAVDPLTGSADGGRLFESLAMAPIA